MSDYLAEVRKEVEEAREALITQYKEFVSEELVPQLKQTEVATLDKAAIVEGALIESDFIDWLIREEFKVDNKGDLYLISLP